MRDFHVFIDYFLKIENQNLYIYLYDLYIHNIYKFLYIKYINTFYIYNIYYV